MEVGIHSRETSNLLLRPYRSRRDPFMMRSKKWNSCGAVWHGFLVCTTLVSDFK